MSNLIKNVLAIDPGINGAFVLTDGRKLETWAMPIKLVGKDKLINFEGVLRILHNAQEKARPHVFLERALPMAMGSKHAFNYGRGFAALEIAIGLVGFPYTLVDPPKWSKVMHEGINSDLKPKAKSLIAVERLCPELFKKLPRNQKGKVLEGPMDGLLIATYGLRQLSGSNNDIGNFY